ncbi:nitronate monooxygenase family protein [Capnocytophaga sp. oral taxon 338]|jgi:Dioxygenases related to 2-nitropropane dioxygenase|uniref:NAD(P)H-dependent flavin oxidoreductase n=1 Tax=Capnocytophaga sp. oral taxon 338 TaxID=710239 RepID=UPI000202CC07|nr:nitronate monooxygenase [Capnocytophaga sp. oral taxon 338]EGD33967.1 enoyl-[acyl carrier protein] reductase II [Capnocytophaga sp. oral taxon 338 str. F0234]
MKTRITELFGIQYPIIQGGMVWASGWQLVTAVSNAGGLGLLGSGSMSSEELRAQIRQCKAHTVKPFGVNVPIMYENSAHTMEVIMQEHVPIVFTSAGNPTLWTAQLQEKGIKVVHVVSSSKFALKAAQVGVDAIVAEGFEAGGHNGREETTSLVLIPEVCKTVNIPVIAAGGIATGEAMYAAMALGAEGIQMGSRFVATEEASVHPLFKKEVIKAKEGDTILTLKELSPVRLLKNKFYGQIETLYNKQEATTENLKQLLGKGRTRLGMYEGNLDEGELEIGQVSSLIHEVKSVSAVFEDILQEFEQTKIRMQRI